MSDIKELNDESLKKANGGIDEGISRDLNITPDESPIGTTSDNNIVPKDIRMK